MRVLFIAGVNQLSDTLCQLRGTSSSVLSPDPVRKNTAPASGSCWLKTSHSCLHEDELRAQDGLLNVAQRKYFLSDLLTLANKDLSGRTRASRWWLSIVSEWEMKILCSLLAKGQIPQRFSLSWLTYCAPCAPACELGLGIPYLHSSLWL